MCNIGHNWHRTLLTTTIDIAVYCTTKQLYLGLTACMSRVAVTSTIDIACYTCNTFRCSFDIDMCIVSTISSRIPNSLSITWISISCTILIVIIYLTLTTTTIHFSHLGTCFQGYIGKSGNGVFTITCTIYRQEITVLVHYGSTNSNVCLFCSTCSMVTTIDTIIYYCTCRCKGDIRFTYITGATF